jgi:glycosyltransferase involved in cell wall biosynthesis
MKINGRFLTQKMTGVQRFAHELTQQIQTVDTDIICPNQPLEISLDSEITKKGKLKSHLWEQLQLPRYCQGELLLNLCNTGPLYYKNQIVTVHDLAFLENPQWFSKNFRRFYQFVIPQICNSSKHILTVSEFSKNEIISKIGIDPDKISVLPNGARSEFFKPKESAKRKNYILTVSSIDPRKNFRFLIEAFKKWNPDSVELIIIGDKPKSFKDDPTLSALCDGSNIIFTGRVSDADLLTYYQEASLFVYPSIYEGFGIPPLEALLCNTPVLLSDIPVFKENYSEIASFSSPTNVDDFSKALKLNYENPTPVNQRFLNEMKSEFTWENSGFKLKSILEKFL